MNLRRLNYSTRISVESLDPKFNIRATLNSFDNKEFATSKHTAEISVQYIKSLLSQQKKLIIGHLGNLPLNS